MLFARKDRKLRSSDGGAAKLAYFDVVAGRGTMLLRNDGTREIEASL